MATIPNSQTIIRLVNVPFNSDYKHTRWFDSLSEQTTYFLNRNVIQQMTDSTIQYDKTLEKPVPFIRVGASLQSLQSVNYCMIQNAEFGTKWWYYFVDHFVYVTPTTTRVYLKIDSLQTFLFDISFKPSFVVREHRPQYEADGTPVINTIDEGLAYGTEYDTVNVAHYNTFSGYQFLVIITKAPCHSGASNAVDAHYIQAPQPLTFYVAPFKVNADGTFRTCVVETFGDTGDSFSCSNPFEILNGIYGAVASVNDVVSIYITDYFGNFCTLQENTGANQDTLAFDGLPNAQEKAMFGTFQCAHILTQSASLLSIDIGNKYTGFNPVNESKLLMYPYAYTILDDLKGNRVVYKNEYFNTAELSMIVKGGLGTSNKVSYSLLGYNANGISETDSETIGDEHGLVSAVPNDLAVLNDALAAFIQGNRNSLENKKDSIVQNGTYNAIGSAIAGVGSAVNRNPVGVLAAGNSLAQGLANTSLSLQAIEAKQQDIANIPPQLAKLGTNTSYDNGYGYKGVWVIKKQIKPEYITKLTDFFKQFGYKTNEVKVPNFHTRQNWNYVETKSCSIQGNLANDYLQEIKNCFDNGISLWHTDDVGNYGLANGVI